MQAKSEIRRFIVDNFLYGQEDHGFDDDVSFLERGFIDSTGVLELVSFIEEAYGIAVNDDELIPENLDSLNKLSSFIARKKVDGNQTCSDTR
jgi:acyl carrier protein